MILLGPLLLLESFKVAMPAVAVDMPRSSKVVDDRLNLALIAAASWGGLRIFLEGSQLILKHVRIFI